MVILGIVAAFLIAYIVYITIHLKRWQTSRQDLGPYQGIAMTQDHPAANITPFDSLESHSGGNVPQFSVYSLIMFYSLLVAKKNKFLFGFSEHNPGEDVRIAICRPDGTWHFTDSCMPSHLQAYQKLTSLHLLYPPDRQPACSPSAPPHDFLPTKPKRQGPLMIQQLWFPIWPKGSTTASMSLRAMSTPLWWSLYYIVDDEPSSIINPPLWHPRTFRYLLTFGVFDFFVYVHTSYHIYTSTRMDDCIRHYFSCTLHPYSTSTLPHNLVMCSTVLAPSQL